MSSENKNVNLRIVETRPGQEYKLTPDCPLPSPMPKAPPLTPMTPGFGNIPIKLDSNAGNSNAGNSNTGNSNAGDSNSCNTGNSKR
ncbi:hypothetical protein NHQ30_005601 [Ciborinia camelliae]|nr:hypothetical protein NHQ30_005601 [Ciborinia camelliae]